MTKLNYIEINPEKTPPIGTIIWLHGLGADGHDFVPIVQQLKLAKESPLRFIFPHAPLRSVTINNGYVMRAWFDIIGIHLQAKIDEEGIEESVININELIAQEEKRGIPAQRIILGGFSQGAVIALNAGLRYPRSLAGISAVSGYLPNAANLFNANLEANLKTPIFLAHGTEDQVVPFLLGQYSYATLLEHKCNVSFHTYRMAHSVCTEEVEDLARWINNISSRKHESV